MTEQFRISSPLLHEYIPLHAKWKPNKAALIDNDVELTWSELEVRTNQVANGLLSLGLAKGDSVAILMDNCVEYAEIIYGIFKAGGVAVPLNLAVPAQGLAAMLKDAAVDIIFVGPDQLDSMQNLDDIGVQPRHVIVRQPGGYTDWRNAFEGMPCGVVVDDSDPVNIIYSSGTTGLPKGIKHGARNRCQAIMEVCIGHRYHEAAVSICPIGLYSNIAWASLLTTLVVGGTCVIRKAFDVEDWLVHVEQYGVTHTMMVPLMFQRILDHSAFNSERVRSLQAVISGGSPLYAELKQQIADRFNCAVIELYGLTEGFMSCLQPEEAKGRLASVGKPMGGGDYIILDNNDNVLPWGEAGEICVRSVHWMIEYHNRPDATAEAQFVDDSGKMWLRTGDIGRTDEDGYLYIVDRKKDMILSGGQNIYPADIEAILVTHPAVAEATVIGIPHEQWGETPLALVVLYETHHATCENELREWVNSRVGSRQKVSAVECRATLPRNPNGKVLKRELRSLYWK